MELFLHCIRQFILFFTTFDFNDFLGHFPSSVIPILACIGLFSFPKTTTLGFPHFHVNRLQMSGR